MYLWVAFVTGLSMDAVAASISSSAAARSVGWPQALKAAFLFGLCGLQSRPRAGWMN